jgi:hypothetical protein
MRKAVSGSSVFAKVLWDSGKKSGLSARIKLN